MSVSSHAVANKFIELAKKEGRLLTNMQLQKLVVIAQGYTLAIFDRPLYREETYAWQWGPVVKNLYRSLQKYGRNCVTEPLKAADSLPEDSEEIEVIEAVWKGYGHFTGSQLSALTHKANTPWSATWINKPFSIIPNSLISEHYKNAIDKAQAKERN